MNTPDCDLCHRPLSDSDVINGFKSCRRCRQGGRESATTNQSKEDTTS